MAYAGTLTYKTELDTSGVQKAGSTIKSIIAGLGITKLISMAMSEINSSIDSAISRIDTFNQYPKVLQNFGVSAEEAKKSIDRIDKSVRGLPTSLDQAVAGVQNIFMVTKDLEEAENIFKAINDSAMVFASGSTEAVDRFAYAYKQALASGKVYAQDFNQMNQAIPGIMDKVADKMGKSFTELKEGLSDGTISMEEFNDALIKLDTEGVEGMEALEKVAKTSTGGIKTAMTNAKTAITRGVAEIIEAFNSNFEDTKFGSLNNFISEMGKNFEKVLKQIAKLISGEISPEEFGKKAIDMISNFIDKATEELPRVIDVGIDVTTNLIKGMADGIPNLMQKASELIITICNTLVEDDNIDKLVDAGLTLLTKLAEGFENSYPKAVEAVSKLEDKILDKLEDPEFVAKLYIRGWNISGQLQLGLLKALPTLISNVYKIPFWILKALSELPVKMWQLGYEAIEGFWRGWRSQMGSLKQRLSNAMSEAVNSVKKKLGIASPSKVFKDEIGQWLPKGIAVGIEANTDSITKAMDDMYNEMNRAIKLENGKMNFDVVSGNVYNKSFFQTPIEIDLNANVEMDSQKVGRLVTPEVTRTIKNGGGV